MRIFIDLGAFDGDTIEIALKKYKRLDKIYAFEPSSNNFKKLTQNFVNKENIILINAAADIKDGESKLYHSQSGVNPTLIQGKIDLSNNGIEVVKTIDFSKFIINNFKLSDNIILKIDIEGKEYDILDRMFEDNSINFINEIYIEWHYAQIGKSFEMSQRYVKQLRRRGFNMTGNNSLDEFIRGVKIGRIKLQLKRYIYSYIYQGNAFLKNKFPYFHSAAKKFKNYFLSCQELKAKK